MPKKVFDSVKTRIFKDRKKRAFSKDDRVAESPKEVWV